MEAIKKQSLDFNIFGKELVCTGISAHTLLSGGNQLVALFAAAAAYVGIKAIFKKSYDYSYSDNIGAPLALTTSSAIGIGYAILGPSIFPW